MKNLTVKFATVLLAGACAASLAASCDKDKTLDKSEAPTSLKISFNSITKAKGSGHGDAAKDKKVNTLQLYSFNSDGSLDNYHSMSGQEVADSYTMEVTAGQKEVWAVANSHDVASFAAVKSLDQLKSLTFSLAKEDTTNFSMVDSAKASVSKGATAQVTVNMRRTVARVLLESIKTDFATGYKDVELKNVKAYLLNVNSTAAVGDSKGKDPMVNKAENKPADYASYVMPEMLCHNVEGNIGKTGKEINQYFYCYSNDNSSAVTKLIIQADLNEKTYYYPIVITDNASAEVPSGVKANTAYKVCNVVITRPGATTPDGKIEYGSIKFTIDVDDWDYWDCGEYRF